LLSRILNPLSNITHPRNDALYTHFISPQNLSGL